MTRLSADRERAPTITTANGCANPCRRFGLGVFGTDQVRLLMDRDGSLRKNGAPPSPEPQAPAGGPSWRLGCETCSPGWIWNFGTVGYDRGAETANMEVLENIRDADPYRFWRHRIRNSSLAIVPRQWSRMGTGG